MLHIVYNTSNIITMHPNQTMNRSSKQAQFTFQHRHLLFAQPAPPLICYVSPTNREHTNKSAENRQDKRRLHEILRCTNIVTLTYPHQAGTSRNAATLGATINNANLPSAKAVLNFIPRIHMVIEFERKKNAIVQNLRLVKISNARCVGGVCLICAKF